MVVIRPVLFCQWCLLSLFALSKLQLAHAQTVKAPVKHIDRKNLILVSEKKDRKGNRLLHVLKVYLINLPNSHQPTQACTHSDIILSILHCQSCRYYNSSRASSQFIDR